MDGWPQQPQGGRHAKPIASSLLLQVPGHQGDEGRPASNHEEREAGDPRRVPKLWHSHVPNGEACCLRHGVPTGVADGHAAVCLAAQEDERDRAVRGNLRPSRDRLHCAVQELRGDCNFSRPHGATTPLRDLAPFRALRIPGSPPREPPDPPSPWPAHPARRPTRSSRPCAPFAPLGSVA